METLTAPTNVLNVVSEPENRESEVSIAYFSYQRARDILHKAELTNEASSCIEMLKKVTLCNKEELAILASELYQDCLSIEEFEEKINRLLSLFVQWRIFFDPY